MDRINYRTYSKLNSLKTFEERFEYVKLNGSVGFETFGYDRYLAEQFYRSKEWKKIRDYVIARDMGCDLGFRDRPITGRVYIHHMNPITFDDLSLGNENVLDPEYLICVSQETHNAIHYGSLKSTKDYEFVERSFGDTTLWRNTNGKQ